MNQGLARMSELVQQSGQRGMGGGAAGGIGRRLAKVVLGSR